MRTVTEQKLSNLLTRLDNFSSKALKSLVEKIGMVGPEGRQHHRKINGLS